MRAVCWYGSHDVRVESVDDPKPINPRDAVVRITLSAICGSDLHLYNGFIPTMQNGDIFAIAGGNCFFCTIEEVPQAYKTFRDKTGNCIKVVIKP